MFLWDVFVWWIGFDGLVMIVKDVVNCVVGCGCFVDVLYGCWFGYLLYLVFV